MKQFEIGTKFKFTVDRVADLQRRISTETAVHINVHSVYEVVEIDTSCDDGAEFYGANAIKTESGVVIKPNAWDGIWAFITNDDEFDPDLGYGASFDYA